MELSLLKTVGWLARKSLLQLSALLRLGHVGAAEVIDGVNEHIEEAASKRRGRTGASALEA